MRARNLFRFRTRGCRDDELQGHEEAAYRLNDLVYPFVRSFLLYCDWFAPGTRRQSRQTTFARRVLLVPRGVARRITDVLLPQLAV